jgi:hypothetical protein
MKDVSEFSNVCTYIRALAWLSHPMAAELRPRLADLQNGPTEIYWSKLKQVCARLDGGDFEGVLTDDIATAGEIVHLVRSSTAPDWQVASHCARLARRYQQKAAENVVCEFSLRSLARFRS